MYLLSEILFSANNHEELKEKNIKINESIKNIGDNYILVAGDSNSWGYVPYDKNWSYLLEKKINRKVLNCGVPAYSTIQELHKTKKILGEGYEKRNLYKPSLIILQYTFNNDFLGDYLFPQYKVQNNILTTNKYLDNIFAALPVGAKSTDRFPKIGKDFTSAETMVVFPVPA